MRAMVSHRTEPKKQEEKSENQISRSAARIVKGKGVSLLEDDGLDTLPINPL